MVEDKKPGFTYWVMSPEEVASSLESDLTKGLTSAEAARRLSQHGYNQLQEAPGRSPVKVFLDQFKSFLIWVLIGAAIVSGFLGNG